MIRKLSSLLIIGILSLNTVFGEDTLKVAWKGVPGTFESTIKADTTSDGDQAHDVYLL